MKRFYVLAIICMLSEWLCGCSYKYAKMYTGEETPLSDVAIIWDPFNYIIRIDGNPTAPSTLDKVEASHVKPGNHVLSYFMIYEYDASGKPYPGMYSIIDFTVNLEAGKTYYCDEIRVDRIATGLSCVEAPEGYSYLSRDDVDSREDIKKEIKILKDKGKLIPVKKGKKGKKLEP